MLFRRCMILYVFFVLIIDLYFLIPAFISKMFNPIAELAVPIEIPSKGTKLEVEIHPEIVEAKILTSNSFLTFSFFHILALFCYFSYNH